MDQLKQELNKRLQTLGFIQKGEAEYRHRDNEKLVVTLLFTDMRVYRGNLRLMECAYDTPLVELFNLFLQKGCTELSADYRRYKIESLEG